MTHPDRLSLQADEVRVLPRSTVLRKRSIAAAIPLKPDAISFLTRSIGFVGDLCLFGLRTLKDATKPPFEGAQIVEQIAEVGANSLTLLVAAGFALGAIMTFHTRSTLVTFGAEAMSPSVQAVAFFIEIGPLVAGLLVAGRVGSGIGAILANMRATEQIDAIEAFSVNSFKFLVVPRVIACFLVLPVLTLFMDCAGLLGGFVSEFATSHLSFPLYMSRAFFGVTWSNFIPPTLKTSVFGFIIGTVSSLFGYTANDGAAGVGRAATNSVVVSSLLIIVADVVLVKCIMFIFPGSAI